MRDWGLISSVFFGVLSVVLAVALYFYGRRYKRLTLTFHQTELQTKRHPDIAITFQGRQIDNLSRLRGVCWNSGKEAIRWEDIPPGLPPMLVFTNARVLSVVDVSATAKAAFGIGQHSDQMAALRFGFLNPRDYGLFEVLYEAHPSALLLLLLVLLFTVNVHGLGPVKRYALVAGLGAVTISGRCAPYQILVSSTTLGYQPKPSGSWRGETTSRQGEWANALALQRFWPRQSPMDPDADHDIFFVLLPGAASTHT